MLRQLLDKMLQHAIRLVMLTGVTFTVTACYGLPPERRYYEEEFEQNKPRETAQHSRTEDAKELINQLLAADEENR